MEGWKEEGGGWPGRPPARGTEEGWSLMIFCARATRGLRRPSLDARSGRSISPHPFRPRGKEVNERGQAAYKLVLAI